MSVDVVLIAGPTASGKSHLALELAARIDATIINADSMQVYGELRTLTARPSSAEEMRAPHRLYGHVSVNTRYSVGRYLEEAAGALAEARGAKRVAIFAGGTGLYFDALTNGLSPIPPVPPEIRDTTRARFERIGRDGFFAELMVRDPATASKLRPSDTQRILRAMDVLEASGRPLSQWQKLAGKPALDGLRMQCFVIAPPREVLVERIERRFETMIKQGALEEARPLMGLDPTLPAAKALGLPQLRRHLAGEITLADAIAGAQLATKQYGKRQMTWFRNRMKGWHWVAETDLSNFVTSMARDLS
ncbi:MAG TPA: tRNA (adenosine(37)-N6)-dimethylallyltransferase MiaA [Micropepsaceae bacterium]|jgi:tRNA dimethylallyltransferase